MSYEEILRLGVSDWVGFLVVMTIIRAFFGDHRPLRAVLPPAGCPGEPDFQEVRGG